MGSRQWKAVHSQLDDRRTRLIVRFFDRRQDPQAAAERAEEARDLMRMLLEELRALRRRNGPPLCELGPGDYRGRGRDRAERITDQIVRAIFDHDGEAAAREPEASTSAGPHPSYATPSGATVPWLLGALRETSAEMHAYLGVTTAQIIQADACAELADRLWLAANYESASVAQLLAVKAGGASIAATLGLGQPELGRMVAFASLHRQCNLLLERWFGSQSDVETARTQRDLRARAVAEALEPALAGDARLAQAGFADWQSFQRYPLMPAWNEDRYAWQRLALERAPATSPEPGPSLGEVMRQAATADGGWALALDRMRRQIARDLTSEDQANASEDELCRRAARRHRHHADPTFAAAVVRHFRALRGRHVGDCGGAERHSLPMVQRPRLPWEMPLPARPTPCATRDLDAREVATPLIASPQRFADPSSRLDEIAGAILAEWASPPTSPLSPYQRLVATFVRVDVFGQRSGPLLPGFAAKLQRASARAERLILERLRAGGDPISTLGPRDWNVGSVGGWDPARARGYLAYGLAIDLGDRPAPARAHAAIYDRAVLLCGPPDRFLSVVGCGDVRRAQSSVRRRFSLTRAPMSPPPAVPDEEFRVRCYAHTAAWYHRLASDSAALRAYLALAGTAQDARALLARIAVLPAHAQDAACALAFADQAPALSHLGATAARLREVIEADRETLAASAPNSRHGFFALPFEVVYALRAEGLRWGACDLGEESGDLGRFDDGW